MPGRADSGQRLRFGQTQCLFECFPLRYAVTYRQPFKRSLGGCTKLDVVLVDEALRLADETR
ncbi:MAG: hypothetical protein WCY32_07285 [Burkholderiaceae bacterium]